VLGAPRNHVRVPTTRPDCRPPATAPAGAVIPPLCPATCPGDRHGRRPGSAFPIARRHILGNCLSMSQQSRLTSPLISVRADQIYFTARLILGAGVGAIAPGLLNAVVPECADKHSSAAADAKPQSVASQTRRQITPRGTVENKQQE